MVIGLSLNPGGHRSRGERHDAHIRHEKEPRPAHRRQDRAIGVRRRHALGLLAGASLAARTVQAQPAKKMPIVGFLHPGLQALGSATMDALRRDMGEAGLINGQTVRLEERWGGGEPARVTALARDLVALGPAVIIAVARASIEAVPGSQPRRADRRQRSRERPAGARLCGEPRQAPAATSPACSSMRRRCAASGCSRSPSWYPTCAGAQCCGTPATGSYQRDAFLAAAKTARLETTLIEYRRPAASSRRRRGGPAA